MLRSVLRSRSPVWVALTVVPQRWHTTQHNNNNNNCSSGGDDAATVSAPRRPRRVVRPAADALSDLLYHGTPASVSVARVHQPTSSSSSPPPPQQQQQVVMDEPLAPSLPQQDDATSVEASSQADAENVVHAEKDARHDDDNDNDDDDVFADLTEAQRRLVLAEHQRWSYAPIDEVVEKVMYYLRATVRPTLVSAEEEHTIFPVLLTRLNELSVRQMIDVIACHWCRSTLVRYGNEVKDRVRDRIAIIATAAAHQRNEAAANAVVDDENDDDDAATSSSSSSLYVEEEEERHAKKLADPILADAVREISAENVVAAFVVMGISGGHRKHDVALFELLGTFVAHFINEIKDAHAIVRMLTALRRAKIVPPPSFVELLARRLPILHKRDPLTALACYRAMANFSRLGHSSITTYRFLADAMTTSMVTQSKLITTTCTNADAALTIDATTTTSSSSSTAAETRADAVRRFRACAGGLRPSMFSRWLLVLGRCGAPHQQYLRPFVHNIIRPSMASFPPPAFTRLLNAIRTFRSTDPELLEPIIDYVCATTTTSSATSISGAYVANRDDFLILLRILAASEAEMPANFQLFVRTTHRIFSAACVDHVTDVVNGDGDGHDDVVPPPPPCVLQPKHLCIVSRCVGCLRRKEHLQVEDVDVLVELISIHFAERMLSWLRMGVVQLREVDDFLQIFREHHLPDIKGVVEELTQERQAIVEDDAHVVADDATTTTTCAVNDYASKLDVDVRDVFTYMLHINDANTHGSYRPVRGDVQIDFRDFLTRVSALDVLTAVDLHEMARPRSLRDTTRRFLEHSVLAKLGDEGEDVVDEINNMLVKRQPVEQTLTRDDLHKLVNLVERTPIASLRRHPVVWRFVWHKAQQLHVEPMKMMAEERLRDAPSA